MEIAREQQEGGKGSSEQDEPTGIEGARAVVGGLADGVRAGCEREEQHGQQGDEDHAPAEGADDVAADGGTDGRRECTDEHGGAHHQAHLVERRLLHDDEEHQRQSDARAGALQKAAEQQLGKTRGGRIEQGACQEEQVGCEEEPLHGEALLEVTGCRDDDGEDQQVACRDPLDGGSGDGKFLHERREGDVHGRLDDDACEGEKAGGDDGEEKAQVCPSLESGYRFGGWHKYILSE